MGALNKVLALVFVFAVLTSLMALTVQSVDAQATFKPSVPEFSVKLIDNSYDVSPTQTTDPYTGKTITKPGYREEHYVIEVTIKNQPFTPYANADGYECSLYYDVQAKPHFDENWRSSSRYWPHTNIGQAGGKETTVTWTLSENIGFLAKPPSGGQLDFRVKAFTGYWVEPTQIDHMLGFHDPRLVEAESSSWSSIQTITITYDSPLQSSSQTALPTNSPATSGNNQQQSPSFMSHPLFLLSVGVLVGGVVAVVVLVFVFRLKTSNYNRNSAFLPP